MVKIIIVDNHALYRIGLITILGNDPRFDVVGDFRSFSAIKSIVPSFSADLAIVDISVNEECGYDVPQYLKRLNSGLKVIILTENKDESHIINAVQEGIDGYLPKDSEPEEILLGIKKVAAGQKYFSVEISAILVNSTYRRQNKGIPFLTTKEKMIIRLLMDGYSSKQIAAKLDVSPRTIHSHRANILSKFNLNNTTQLVTKIAEQKIIL
jgi:DNA-binding NarL/FixJ family response regulator